MDQDWTEVKWDKRSAAKKGTKAARISQAKRDGEIISMEKKYHAGTNKSAHSGPLKSAKKLEEDTEQFALGSVGHDMKMAIQKARLEKRMSQKALAQAIGEKESVINSYEAGRAIPNPTIISKIERALGTRLPRQSHKAKEQKKK